MHFIGMLAFTMPMPMSYDIGLTILSLLVAIVVTSGGFYVISRSNDSPLYLILSGIFMGLGIIARERRNACGRNHQPCPPAFQESDSAAGASGSERSHFEK